MKNYLIVFFAVTGEMIEWYIDKGVNLRNITHSARFANMIQYCNMEPARVLFVSEDFTEVKCLEL